MVKGKRGRNPKKLGRRFSVEDRAQIVGAHNYGTPVKKLARDWDTYPKTIREIFKKQRLKGSVKDVERSGRPPKTTKREDRALKFHILNTPKTSSRAMALKIAPSFIKNKVSYKLIQRRIKSFGLFSYVARKKPLLSDANIERRFEWAKKHLSWTSEDWKRVAFSDESPFSLFQWTGRVFVWRRPGEAFKFQNLCSTVKHGGGKIQCWGVFTYWGPGPLYRIQGIMDGKKYREILKHKMAPYLHSLKGKTGCQA